MADYEQLVFEGLEWNAGDIQKRQDSIGYSLRYGAFLNDTKAELGHGKWEDYMEAIDVKPTWSKILMSLSKSTLTLEHPDALPPVIDLLGDHLHHSFVIQAFALGLLLCLNDALQETKGVQPSLVPAAHRLDDVAFNLFSECHKAMALLAYSKSVATFTEFPNQADYRFGWEGVSIQAYTYSVANF